MESYSYISSPTSSVYSSSASSTPTMNNEAEANMPQISRQTSKEWSLVDSKNVIVIEGDESTFTDHGGVCYNYDEEVWETRYILENDGKIDSSVTMRVSNYERDPGPDNEHALDRSEALEAIGRAGLASGRLYIRQGDGLRILSGFFLEEQFFVTLGEEDGGFSTTKAMKKPENGITYVSQSRTCSPEVGALPVHLVHTSKDEFTVFMLDDFDGVVHGLKGTITLKDLLATDKYLYVDEEEPESQWENIRLFSVGYNSSCSSGEFSRYVQDFVSSLPTVQKRKLRRNDIQPAKLNFDKYFKPNDRTVAFGTLPPLDKQKSNPDDEVEVSRWNHTIPMWRGAEGSLVGYAVFHPGKSWETFILGMLLGGKSSIAMNEFVRFTEDDIFLLEYIINKHT